MTNKEPILEVACDCEALAERLVIELGRIDCTYVKEILNDA